MAQSDPVRMPRMVDDPPTLIAWSADELAVFFTFFFIGMMIEQLLILSLIGAVSLRFIRRYRNRSQKGAMVHQLYWIGVWPNKARSIGNTFERDHIG